jgi:hypothetical protein
MKIGIDGNMWYCSNGMCLGDPRAKFTFERTLRQAAAAYLNQFGEGGLESVPNALGSHLDDTPEQYHSES